MAIVLAVGGVAAWASGVAAVVGSHMPVTAAILPVCIGVAVLKYRLFEIDRIISRVISYTAVTALLAGVFAGLVVLAADVHPFKQPVAVAASTLVVAALFNPLRKRVQRTATAGSTGPATTPRWSWPPSLRGYAEPWTSTRCGVT